MSPTIQIIPLSSSSIISCQTILDPQEPSPIIWFSPCPTSEGESWSITPLPSTLTSSISATQPHPVRVQSRHKAVFLCRVNRGKMSPLCLAVVLCILPSQFSYKYFVTMRPQHRPANGTAWKKKSHISIFLVQLRFEVWYSIKLLIILLNLFILKAKVHPRQSSIQLSLS